MGVANGEECFCGKYSDDPARYGLCSNTGCSCDHQCTANSQHILDWYDLLMRPTHVIFTVSVREVRVPHNMLDLKTQPNNCSGVGFEEITTT